MIDKLTLTASTKDNEINMIVSTNNLTTFENTKNNTDKIINNKLTKNFTGMYIQIDVKKETIKIEGSLSKYLYHAKNGVFANHFQNYSVAEIQKAITLLKENTKIDIDKAQIYFVEIGLNLELPRPAQEYFDLIKSITPATKNEKLIFIQNPIYKENTVYTTIMHRDIRKHYKMYDKTAELQSKHKETDKSKFILRIETVYKRKLNMTVAEFMHPHTLKDTLNEFKKTWLSLEFESDLIFPKGINNLQTKLCKELLEAKNSKDVTEKYRIQNKNGILSDRAFRTQREFIERKWNDIKTEIKSRKTDIEIELINAIHNELENATY